MMCTSSSYLNHGEPRAGKWREQTERATHARPFQQGCEEQGRRTARCTAGQLSSASVLTATWPSLPAPGSRARLHRTPHTPPWPATQTGRQIYINEQGRIHMFSHTPHTPPWPAGHTGRRTNSNGGLFSREGQPQLDSPLLRKGATQLCAGMPHCTATAHPGHTVAQCMALRQQEAHQYSHHTHIPHTCSASTSSVGFSAALPYLEGAGQQDIASGTAPRRLADMRCSHLAVMWLDRCRAGRTGSRCRHAQSSFHEPPTAAASRQLLSCFQPTALTWPGCPPWWPPPAPSCAA